MDDDFGESKNSAISATSFGSRNFLSGCRSVIISIILSFLSSLDAKSVSVKVGAMAFILIVGANSAPNDFTNHSTADFAAATLA